MATFYTSPSKPVHFGQFDVSSLDGDQRAARVGLVDNGAVVDVWIDTDGNKSLDTKIVEIHTTDALKVGEDVNVISLY